MIFSEVSQYFFKISQESSRLIITELLSDLLSKVSPHEARHISYLALGTLEPIYKSNQFNFAEKSIFKVLAKLSNKTDQEFKLIVKQTGDIGLAIMNLDINSNNLNLSIENVYDRLLEIQTVGGTGSQEIKADLLHKLLSEVDILSAQFIVKIILDNMRLGFSDMTFIDALSWMLSGNKSNRLEIERAYNVCADLGLISLILKQEGMQGIKDMKPTIGIPIRPAAAERLESTKAVIDKIGPCIAQPKLDGFRLQVHIDKTKLEPELAFYSRNLINMSDIFPDIRDSIVNLPVTTLIVEGEAIAYNEETQTVLPFQETIKRKRKHGVEEAAQSVPLRFYIFDILYLDGDTLIDLTHSERRYLLEKILKNFKSSSIFLLEEKKCDNSQELDIYLNEQIAQGLEGIVVKKLDGKYIPGKRNFNWIKLKRHQATMSTLGKEHESKILDTLDCVILGYYYGQGKRVNFGIGAILVGVYNKAQDKFETIAKIGTGLTDQEWIDIKSKCDQKVSLEQPHNVICSPELAPDIWVNPDIVILILADEITQSSMHSSGYSLRFPRFMGYALDKSEEQTTTVFEVSELYKLQYK